MKTLRQLLISGASRRTQALLALPAALPPLASGAMQAAEILAQMLRG